MQFNNLDQKCNCERCFFSKTDDHHVVTVWDSGKQESDGGIGCCWSTAKVIVLFLFGFENSNVCLAWI